MFIGLLFLGEEVSRIEMGTNLPQLAASDLANPVLVPPRTDGLMIPNLTAPVVHIDNVAIRTVPEPSTLLLSLAGICGLLLKRRSV
jgi:hypothetical protein